MLKDMYIFELKGMDELSKLIKLVFDNLHLQPVDKSMSSQKLCAVLKSAQCSTMFAWANIYREFMLDRNTDYYPVPCYDMGGVYNSDLVDSPVQLNVDMDTSNDVCVPTFTVEVCPMPAEIYSVLLREGFDAYHTRISVFEEDTDSDV